ncbi:trafficking protein particle complex subunit 1 isoform X2 [Spatholobus suberectus]|nr:trafficking protein particle complex subunit 1 isoform X2 [Spatholobus suberectus]
MPFRRDPLVLSKSKQASADQSGSLPLNQQNVLIVCAKNCTELPLMLKSISIELEDDAEKTCSIQHGSEELSNPSLLVPWEEFKKVFSVSSNTTLSWVVTKQKLPDVNLELPPLIVSLNAPYAIVGDPFTYYIRMSNQTQLLQEVKYSLADAEFCVIWVS